MLKTEEQQLSLSDEEQLKQNSRLISEFKRNKLNDEARSNWDKFFKRNSTNFFKDRHWTCKEFDELLPRNLSGKCLFDIGCGVGNFILPIIQTSQDTKFYACDFSLRAIDFVKADKRYDEKLVKVFCADVCDPNSFGDNISLDSMDIVCLIFVLSAIDPLKFSIVLKNLYKVTKTGGVILFRDYAINDHAMIRFGPGHKIGDKFYVRQDNTFAYYFSKEELSSMFENTGFRTIDIHYVHRETNNRKKNITVQRIFLQAKFIK